MELLKFLIWKNTNRLDLIQIHTRIREHHYTEQETTNKLIQLSENARSFAHFCSQNECNVLFCSYIDTYHRETINSENPILGCLFIFFVLRHVPFQVAETKRAREA